MNIPEIINRYRQAYLHLYGKDIELVEENGRIKFPAPEPAKFIKMFPADVEQAAIELESRIDRDNQEQKR